MTADMPLIDFEKVKRGANGMLSSDVYREIYLRTKKAAPGIAVEVGTAHGAGTIALGLAAKETGGKVHTFDKIVGGSRDRYGGIDDNRAIIERNLAYFGLRDFVELHIGNIEDTFHKAGSEDIGILMLDADGAIDRDFSFFYDRLEEGAIIIIDDCSDVGRVFREKKQFRIDLKHRLTYRLTGLFKRMGLLEEDVVIGNTFFGRKPFGASRFDAVDTSEIFRVYRSLVHTRGHLVRPQTLRLRQYASKVPGARNLYRCIAKRRD